MRDKYEDESRLHMEIVREETEDGENGGKERKGGRRSNAQESIGREMEELIPFELGEQGHIITIFQRP